MPGRLEEIHHAKEEGIYFQFLTSPVEILGKDGWVTSIKCRRIKLGEPDESGRRRPEPIEGSEFELETDEVIIAIGTTANPLVPKSTKNLELNKRGYISADSQTGATSRPGIFAGGDIVTGSATVITAMGAGKRAAVAIAEFLKSKD
jgi:glutamate synthase (NADPH/NADH) small chain